VSILIKPGFKPTLYFARMGDTALTEAAAVTGPREVLLRLELRDGGALGQRQECEPAQHLRI